MSYAASTSLHPLVAQYLVDTKKFFCPFLERGYCRDPSKCKFSHDIYESIKIPTDYCHFYLANQCLYGQECKFRHTEPLISAPSTSNSSSSTSPSSLSSSSSPSTERTSNTIDNYDDSEQYRPELGEEEEESYIIDEEGQNCDLCGRSCLHPYDPEQLRQHREECLREHEREMELSFAVQRSRDKVCGICMDVVVEKRPITSSRFGILEKCNHIFCLDCIRKWRGTKQFERKTIRACPECRVSSDFVVPSKYWIEDQDDKEKLITDYKAALKSKPCKYFNEGKGECPFAGSCFYRHAYPDGRIAKLETPKPRRRAYGSRATSSTVANYILWNILTTNEEDDWSNEDLESLFLEPDFELSDDDDDLQDYDLDDFY